MSPALRLTLSSSVAFMFYGLWAYWANSSIDIPHQDTVRAALVQGVYSGLMTLIFTFLLENVASKFNGHYLSLTLVTPFICSIYKSTIRNKVIFSSFQNGLLNLARFSQKPKHILWLSPILPLSLQTTFVVTVNWLNQTPNLILTVIPSVLFSAVYGYMYLFSFLKATSPEVDLSSTK